MPSLTFFRFRYMNIVLQVKFAIDLDILLLD